MSTLIRRAELESERVALIRFLSSYLSPDADERRYNWLYCESPHGKAVAWVADDQVESKIAGLSAAFPRQMYRHGEEATGYVLGDFCIHPHFRSLGPALALQRKTLEDLSRLGKSFVYDFPSQSMLAIYKRLGCDPNGRVIRYAKPLRAGRKLERLLPGKKAARALAVPVNFALRLKDLARKRRAPCTIAPESGPCSGEFTEASRQWSRRIGICTARTADYLNWRFFRHPRKHYRMLTARASGELRGYLIYEVSAADAVISDLMAADDAIYEALLCEAVFELRDQRLDTLSAPLPAAHPARAVFAKWGFRERETSPLVLLHTVDRARFRNEPVEDWYLLHGDRES